jgi:hypothetical protein
MQRLKMGTCPLGEKTLTAKHRSSRIAGVGVQLAVQCTEIICRERKEEEVPRGPHRAVETMMMIDK